MEHSTFFGKLLMLSGNLHTERAEAAYRTMYQATESELLAIALGEVGCFERKDIWIERMPCLSLTTPFFMTLHGLFAN